MFQSQALCRDLATFIWGIFPDHKRIFVYREIRNSLPFNTTSASSSSSSSRTSTTATGTISTPISTSNYNNLPSTVNFNSDDSQNGDNSILTGYIQFLEILIKSCNELLSWCLTLDETCWALNRQTCPDEFYLHFKRDRKEQYSGSKGDNYSYAENECYYDDEINTHAPTTNPTTNTTRLYNDTRLNSNDFPNQYNNNNNKSRNRYKYLRGDTLQEEDDDHMNYHYQHKRSSHNNSGTAASQGLYMRDSSVAQYLSRETDETRIPSFLEVGMHAIRNHILLSPRLTDFVHICLQTLSNTIERNYDDLNMHDSTFSSHTMTSSSSSSSYGISPNSVANIFPSEYSILYKNNDTNLSNTSVETDSQTISNYNNMKLDMKNSNNTSSIINNTTDMEGVTSPSSTNTNMNISKVVCEEIVDVLLSFLQLLETVDIPDSAVIYPTIKTRKAVWRKYGAPLMQLHSLASAIRSRKRNANHK